MSKVFYEILQGFKEFAETTGNEKLLAEVRKQMAAVTFEDTEASKKKE
ncbi:MAG: hypothetical protein J5852_00845 [Clostridia bacterium]|nr:hypothetical protein [Clostridia bacterium]